MKKYTIAIDLGERNVIAVAGSRESDEAPIRVAAVASRDTRGIRSGRIENIAQVNEALSSVIAELESKLNVKIQQAYGGISGEYVRNERHSESVPVAEPNNGVGSVDVGALHSLMRNVVAPEADSILEYTPQNYVVDNRPEECSPVGTFGQTISSTFNFILCENEALKRLGHAFKQSGIMLKRCFPNAVTAAEAVITKDEMEAGVAVVDLGEGMTNVSIFHKGVLRYIASIPIGGSALNTDIRSLMIQEKSIESVKCTHGVAVAELAAPGEIIVEGRTVREKRSILLHNLGVAIQERMTDITIFVHREIRDAGFNNRLPYGIVLTGGGANLREVDELFRRNLNSEVRIGNPSEEISEDSDERIALPEYATVIGILKRGVEMDSKGVGRPCTVDEQPVEEEPPIVIGSPYGTAAANKGFVAEQPESEKKTTQKPTEEKSKKRPEKRSLVDRMLKGINDFFSSPDNDTPLK